MVASIWGTGRRLDESLFKAAYKFEFFQAVRLLALMEAERNPQRHTVKADEAVRFAVESTVAFPASPVVEIEAGKGSAPARMVVTFLGLIGPSGVLPYSYTEFAIHQKAFGDPSYAAFFDLFHNRLLSLFYRAWEKHHFVIGFEQASRTPSARDALTGYLFDLIGMGTAGLRDRMALPDEALLRYVGLLAQRPHSAECLRALLHDFFVVPVFVEQLLGRWHALEEDELSVLGTSTLSSQLGEGTVAGDMVWSCQAMIRIVLGPLTAPEFFQFLPDRKTFREASELIRWFLGPTIDFELQPVLASNEVPHWCRLGDTGRGGPRLGWYTWLTDEPFHHPATDAVFAESECVYMEA